jgi:hypothetical protein
MSGKRRWPTGREVVVAPTAVGTSFPPPIPLPHVIPTLRHNGIPRRMAPSPRIRSWLDPLWMFGGNVLTALTTSGRRPQTVESGVGKPSGVRSAADFEFRLPTRSPRSVPTWPPNGTRRRTVTADRIKWRPGQAHRSGGNAKNARSTNGKLRSAIERANPNQEGVRSAVERSPPPPTASARSLPRSRRNGTRPRTLPVRLLTLFGAATKKFGGGAGQTPLTSGQL